MEVDRQAISANRDGRAAGLSATAPQLSARCLEQRLLDSKGAEETLAELESELAGIESNVDSLLNRQREIAAQLRSMRGP
ncbi:MAG: hypothetical protein WBM00_07460 [Solirubrobacterales bacterium]